MARGLLALGAMVELRMGEQERELEAACLGLLAHTSRHEPAKLAGLYRDFERAVLDRLLAVEQVLLPGYAEHDPGRAQTLRGDHGAIRDLLFRLGADLELGGLRRDRVEALLATLHEHAGREHAWLLPWARDAVPAELQERLAHRVEKSIHALERLVSRLRSLPGDDAE